MKNIIKQITPYFQKLRWQLHANPELRYEEKQTAALIAKELEKLGLKVHTDVGKTGVVALLDSGKAGKTVALRADMDALPMQEETQLAYQSTVPGKMHACGHDGHVTTLLMAAQVLTTFKDQLQGKVKFIFQPAEEGGRGAKAMIDEGVLENPKVDAIFAYHNHPAYETGTIFTRAGCVLFSNTEFTFTINGKGGHAATPDSVIDPIIIGATITQNIPNLVRQLSDPLDPTIISITQFNSGTAFNIIPDTAILCGTIRASSEEKKVLAQKKLTTLIQGIVAAYNARVTIEFNELLPATINSTTETNLVLSSAKIIFGENNVQIKKLPARASEDFSFYLQKIPGCYFFVGNGVTSAACHNSKYDFNDAILPIACEMLCAVAIAYLNQNLTSQDRSPSHSVI